MEKLEIVFGGLLAVCWWLFCLLIKGFFVVTGLVIVPLAVTYSYLRRLPVLPLVTWPWRNPEEAYTSKGLNCKDIINEPGNRHWHEYVVEKDWSQLRFFIYWATIRNSSHNIQKKLLCANLSKLKKVVYAYNSFTKHETKPTSVGAVHHWWSPWPKRVRAALGEDGTYYDVSLIRCNFMYYFTVRRVKVFKKQEYFKRVWYKPWKKVSLGKQKRHSEFIIGCKQYWYRIYFTVTDHPDKPVYPFNRAGQTINFAYRKDADWA